jgi:hypothetical protein
MGQEDRDMQLHNEKSIRSSLVDADTITITLPHGRQFAFPRTRGLASREMDDDVQGEKLGRQETHYGFWKRQDIKLQQVGTYQKGICTNAVEVPAQIRKDRAGTP